VAATDAARAWTQLVRNPDDLVELEDRLSRARGRVRDVARGFADELLVDVDGPDGEWLVGTQASAWQVSRGSSVGSAHVGDRAADEIASAARLLAGAEVRGMRVDRGLDLIVELDGGGRLLVQAKAASPAHDDDPPYWEVFTPDGLVLAAGPGPRWSATPADVAEQQLPRPAPTNGLGRGRPGTRSRALTLPQLLVAGCAVLVAIGALVRGDGKRPTALLGAAAGVVVLGRALSARCSGT